MASKIIMEDSRKSTKPLPWADKFCDYIERGILWFFDDYNSKKTNYWIKNNYAPADEHDPATNLHVVGTIPVSAYLRLQQYPGCKVSCLRTPLIWACVHKTNKSETLSFYSTVENCCWRGWILYFWLFLCEMESELILWLYYSIGWQECMNGEFLRVGPNPKFQPVASYHWYFLVANLQLFWLGLFEHAIATFWTNYSFLDNVFGILIASCGIVRLDQSSASSGLCFEGWFVVIDYAWIQGSLRSFIAHMVFWYGPLDVSAGLMEMGAYSVC